MLLKKKQQQPKKNASKKLKIDPMKIEKAAAKGRDNEAITK